MRKLNFKDMFKRQPRVAPTFTDEEKKEWKEKYIQQFGTEKIYADAENLRKGIGKVKMLNSIFLVLAIGFFVSTIAITFFTLPVPAGQEIWVLRGLTGFFMFGLIAQNLMDGPFIRAYRMGRMKGKTLVLIKRSDNKWGWLFDTVRGQSVTSDIYGEFAISKESMGTLDGVAMGVADDSEGITLPLQLTKIAQDLKVEGIDNMGTVESLYNLDEKGQEYMKIKATFEAEVEELKKAITKNDKHDKPIIAQIEQHEAGLTKVEGVLEYLGQIQNDYSALSRLNKKTLVLKPLLDFFETYANNPIFKRSSRERAVAMEKAKQNKGENMGQWVMYLGGLMLAAGVTIYLIQTGAGESVVSAVDSSTAGISVPSPQGVN